MRMRVCYLDYHEAGLCCYLVIHIGNVLRPLQLFYFHLWPIYWFSLVDSLLALAINRYDILVRLFQLYSPGIDSLTLSFSLLFPRRNLLVGCSPIVGTVSLRVPTASATDFSTFDTLHRVRFIPTARCVSAADVVYRRIDIFNTKVNWY
jgi:hypothetical protein